MSKLILYSSPPLPSCAERQMARFKPLNSHQVVECFNTTQPLLAVYPSVYPYVCLTVRNTLACSGLRRQAESGPLGPVSQGR